MVYVSRYPIQVFWKRGRLGALSRRCPICRAAAAFAATRLEAVQEVQDAIEAWIEAMTAGWQSGSPPFEGRARAARLAAE